MHNLLRELHKFPHWKMLPQRGYLNKSVTFFRHLTALWWIISKRHICMNFWGDRSTGKGTWHSYMTFSLTSFIITSHHNQIEGKRTEWITMYSKASHIYSLMVMVSTALAHYPVYDAATINLIHSCNYNTPFMLF